MRGEEQENGLIGNAVMQLRRSIRTITCHVEISVQQCCFCWWSTQETLWHEVRKGEMDWTPFERLHGKEITSRIGSVSRKPKFN